jgi:hypothetical protein
MLFKPAHYALSNAFPHLGIILYTVNILSVKQKTFETEVYLKLKHNGKLENKLDSVVTNNENCQCCQRKIRLKLPEIYISSWFSRRLF